jgi:hypothetical protein
MAKILNTSKITTPIPKVIELPDELVLNGQVYDKSTFAAKSLDFLHIPVSTKNEIIMSKMMCIDSVANFGRTMNNLIVDNTNPNVYYTFGFGTYDVSALNRCYKITRTSTGLQYQSIIVGGETTYACTYEIIQQDTGRIYYFRHRNYEPGTIYIGYIDKATFTITETQPAGNRIKILKVTDSFIYFATCYPQANYICKYNKNSNSVTVLFSQAYTTAQQQTYSCVPSDLTNDNEFYIVRDNAVNGFSHSILYTKYTIDFVKETVTYQDVTADTSMRIAGTPFSSTNNIRIQHELFFVKDNGKTYMNHIVYWHGTGSYASAANALNVDKSSIFTYELIDSTTWKMVSYVDFNPTIYRQIMPLYNNKVMIAMYEGGVHFYSWNSGTKSFEKISTYEFPTMMVGVDTNNNTYVYLQDYSLEMLSNTLPIQIYADFEYEDYQYSGAEINAAVKIYARNFVGNYLNANLELVLSGPVKFTDTGLKKKTVTTSNLNTLSIPVTITGAGLLRVNTKIL